ncbi:hypothetical protein [Bacillus cereus]|uniref:Uncharacterized protein n=1 Tax=Bacillus cereus 03BB108 TaxID=451709 RepID=A0AAN0SRB8_BACCE|nr:hypothetical protein [Bacillus cereus]AJI09050.1 hypothetical protein AK40_6090 [Bacillus cereus 03BB108]EDX59517.1 conserved hypothetical protein [Bacillus cereus 03BB108]QKG98742.1 hypothetical protein FOC96_00360 [Bacillus cereus]
MVKGPLITESEFASLKHKLEKEKQMVLEIYRIAFDSFLEKGFTSEFLIGEIRKQMNSGHDYLEIKLVNHDIVDKHNVFNFRRMIGATFSYFFSWFFYDRVVIKRKFWKYRKVVWKIATPFREDEIIQLSMKEIAEEVIDKSKVFKNIINDLEKSNIRATEHIIGEIFILHLTWGEGDKINEG